MSERDDFGAFLVGFIVGGLTGAVSALLFAPQSGEETRTLIKDKAIVLKDQTSETVTESIEKAEAYAKDAVAKAEKLLEDAKKKANEIAEKGQVMLEASKEKVTKAIPQTKKPAASK
ncbi:MAG: YtxH domain-containing protein [Pelolinea sp.]|nr:YtxH domain-containing protein [Pelolinea sp.]